MRAREGCIINISSVSGLMGNAGQCNYAASKAGLNGLTKSVAKELAPKNIRCNAIAPGFIATDIRSPVRPGDRVETACRIKRAKPPCYFAEGTMKVGDKVAVTAAFSFAVTGA